MTEEKLPQEEEAQTTPSPESESEENSDELESLFAEDPESEDTDSDDKDDKIKSLEDKVERIRKGVAKFFTENGTAKKAEPIQEVTPKTETTPNNDLEVLFFESKPEAELVRDDLKKVAQARGISVLQAWREEDWLREKASAKKELREVEEKNKTKINKPSSGSAAKTVDISSVKPEEVSSLTPSQKSEWFKSQALKERMGG